MSATFTDLAEGRRLLDAMREEEKNSHPYDPRPRAVDWLVWMGNNVEAMMNCIEALAQREPIEPTVQSSPRRYEGKCMSSSPVIVGGHHVCDLEFGHSGAHQDESGMSWTQQTTVPVDETRTEWGVRRPPRFNSTIAWMTSRSEAESLAAAWDNGSKVVSRIVYIGPWTEESGIADPTTPEGIAELRRIATDGWMIRPHRVLALLDAFDRQERELAGYRAEEQRVREWNALVAEGNVRCTYCDLRHAEREEYPCGDARDQNSHHYDPDELADDRRRELDGDS